MDFESIATAIRDMRSATITGDVAMTAAEVMTALVAAKVAH